MCLMKMDEFHCERFLLSHEPVNYVSKLNSLKNINNFFPPRVGYSTAQMFKIRHHLK